MKNSLSLLTLITLLLIYSCKERSNETSTSNIEPTEKWIKLFNGKDLNDWIIKIKGYPAGENYKNTFRVEDGILKVNYDEYDDIFNSSFGHIFYNKSFSNYKFRMDYRFTGKQLSDGPNWATRNSGIMFHCENPKNMGIEQDFPVCVEVQLLGGLGKEERPTGNICTPGSHIIMDNELITDHVINSSSKTFHGDQWVHVEIEVINDSIITHKINGKKVIFYSKPTIGGKGVRGANDVFFWKAQEGKPLKSGYISLQSESHPVEFKNIEILEL